MKTNTLGNSDLTITPIGLGAWAIGGDWKFGWGAQDDDDSIAAIHRALELGINWIDTAAIYGLGHSEEVVARALREWNGARPFVFTKGGMIWDEQRNISYSLRADSVRRECEASLRRLQTEVIDLYQIHWTAEDPDETLEGWRMLAALKDEGKVRWIGVSNASVEEMEKMQQIAPITSLQPHYSLMRREVGNAQLPWCQRHGVGDAGHLNQPSVAVEHALDEFAARQLGQLLRDLLFHSLENLRRGRYEPDAFEAGAVFGLAAGDAAGDPALA